MMQNLPKSTRVDHLKKHRQSFDCVGNNSNIRMAEFGSGHKRKELERDIKKE